MSHLNLPSRIHEPQKVKWVADGYTFTCIVDDRFTPISAPIENREPKAGFKDTSYKDLKPVRLLNGNYVSACLDLD